MRCQARIFLLVHPGEPAPIESGRADQRPSGLSAPTGPMAWRNVNQLILVADRFTRRGFHESNDPDLPPNLRGFRVGNAPCPVRGHDVHEIDAERLRLQVDRARAWARRPLNIDLADVLSRR